MNKFEFVPVAWGPHVVGQGGRPEVCEGGGVPCDLSHGYLQSVDRYD